MKFFVRSPGNALDLGNAQRDALEDLFVYIETHSGDVLSATSRDEMAALIHGSETWRTLREMSATELDSFGISADMTVEEINKVRA